MTVQRIHNGQNLPEILHGGVVAIGNFDGVHLGHRAVLGRALDIAKSENRPALVLTFEPHPRTVFRPDQPVFRLTPPELKAELFGHLGFSAVVEQNFTKDFSSQSAETFITDVLQNMLGASHIVTGFDFHFGKGREGGPAFLLDAGKRHNFGVTLLDAERDNSSGEAIVISSSRIRAALEAGDCASANHLLGYHYNVRGTVIKGKQLGRTLGYPTANMVLPDENSLAHGIYAVRYRRENGALHDGVASFGRRPTVDTDGAPLLETFLFDFTSDLYGEQGTVTLVKRLRGEEKFDSLDALTIQMKRDELDARATLKELKPLSDLDAKLNFESHI